MLYVMGNEAWNTIKESSNLDKTEQLCSRRSHPIFFVAIVDTQYVSS